MVDFVGFDLDEHRNKRKFSEEVFVRQYCRLSICIGGRYFIDNVKINIVQVIAK